MIKKIFTDIEACFPARLRSIMPMEGRYVIQKKSLPLWRD